MMNNSNKQIAKNTVLLYVRMLFLLVIALYTSRQFLYILGEEDYGIYNVVGGVIAMLGFLSNSMISSTQRFISYEQGTNNLNRQKIVFSSAIRIHVLLAFIIFIISETAGLWFLNCKMNISAERMIAANWVFQFSIFTFVTAIVTVPFMASVIAHEKMGMYALVSVLDGVLKLLIVFILTISNSWDKLIIYGFLLFLISLTDLTIYFIYTRKNFHECRWVKSRDVDLSKSMLQFAGWSFLGNFGFSMKDSGVNVVINLFFGAKVNAARSIAYQVTAAVNQFVSNFQTAVNPQIVKRYASGEIDSMIYLIRNASKYSFCLLSLIVIPLFTKLPYALSLWLVDVPKYTLEFLRLALIMSIINSMFGPLVTGLQATGKIKVFQITISIIMFLDLPLSYFLLSKGCEPYSVMYVAIGTAFVGLVARLIILSSYISIGFWSFFSGIILRNLFSFSIMLIPMMYINRFAPDTILGFIVLSLISLSWSIFIIWFLILSKSERKLIFDFIKQRVFSFGYNHKG